MNRFPFMYGISTNVRQFHFTMLLPCHIYAIINQLSIRCDVRLNEEQFYKRNFNLVLKETIILLDNVILEISPGRSTIDRTIVKRNDVDRITSNPSPYPSHPRLNLKINNCRERFLSFQRPGLLSPWKQPYILFTLVFHALRGNEKKQLVNLRSRLIPLKYPFLSSVSIGRWTWREARPTSGSLRLNRPIRSLWLVLKRTPPPGLIVPGGLIQGLPRWTAATTCSRAVRTVTAPILEEKAGPRNRSTVYAFFIDFSNDEWHQPSTSLSLLSW